MYYVHRKKRACFRDQIIGRLFHNNLFKHLICIKFLNEPVRFSNCSVEKSSFTCNNKFKYIYIYIYLQLSQKQTHLTP